MVPNPPILPMVVAHRGASADAPENTLAAFNLAWEQGADAIEGDFHLTKDGLIVCHHDPDVITVTGGKQKIAHASFADLRVLMGSRPLHLLSEILESLPRGKGIFIEIKCGPEIIDLLAEVLDKTQLAENKVTIISFNEAVISGIKELRPQYEAHWLVDFASGRLRLSPDSGSIISTLQRLHANGVGLKADPRIAKSFIREIRSAGYALHVWTVDSCLMASRFVSLGVDAITTNVPGLLRSHLRKKFKYR